MEKVKKSKEESESVNSELTIRRRKKLMKEQWTKVWSFGTKPC